MYIYIYICIYGHVFFSAPVCSIGIRPKISKSIFHMADWLKTSHTHFNKHKMRIGNFKFLILSNGSMLWAKNDLFTLWSLGITSIMFWKCWLWKWITKRSAENKNQRGAHFFHGKSIFRAQNDHRFFVMQKTALFFIK